MTIPHIWMHLPVLPSSLPPPPFHSFFSFLSPFFLFFWNHKRLQTFSVMELILGCVLAIRNQVLGSHHMNKKPALLVSLGHNYHFPSYWYVGVSRSFPSQSFWDVVEGGLTVDTLVLKIPIWALGVKEMADFQGRRFYFQCKTSPLVIPTF